jgi:2-C-methyl-D-erythritol 4-phosphate cytidylyltransferase
MTSGRGRRIAAEDESLVGGLLLAASVTSLRAEPLASAEEKDLLWSPLLGRPLPAWSFQALLEVEELAELVVVVNPGKEGAAFEMVEALHPPDHQTVLVRPCVDPCRAVELGLAELAARYRLVVIQEASRPLVTPESIRRGIQVAQEYPNCGAIACVPVKETIKRVEEGVVVGTLPRERLALLQTPQVFPVRLLQSAFSSFRRSSGSSQEVEAVADPVAVALWAGMRLVPFATPGEDVLVAGPGDLGIAEVLLRHRAS